MSQPTDSHAELLGSVVDSLAAVALRDRGPRGESRVLLPSRDAVLGCVEGIRRVFFPGYFGATDLHDKSVQYYIGATLDRLIHEMEEQIARAVAFTEGHNHATCLHCKEKSLHATSTFIARLPEVRRLISADVDAAFDGDPALPTKDEAIFSYPGVFALTEQRIAHELYLLEVPLIPRIITEHAHSLTGIDIHPGARIGERWVLVDLVASVDL